jgi:hypothetical protein
MNELESYPDDLPSAGFASVKMVRRQSTPEQLRFKKQHLEEELKRVNEAIEFLEKNPDFEKGLQLISMAL